jgi:cobalt/nickel transport system ATP-binding protein
MGGKWSNHHQHVSGKGGDVNAVLTLNDVFYRYPGSDSSALQGATLCLPTSQRVVVIGRNGSGKSTLFLHCNGILRPEKGKVCFDGQPIAYDRRSLRELRRQVGVVFQNPDDQLFSASVAQDISFGPLNLGLNQDEARRRVEKVADLCDVANLLERPTHALSSGEKARVALAGMLAMNPTVLLADELTASLDPWMRRQVFVIFERLMDQGKTVVLATHSIEVAQHWADFVVVMDSGRVVAADTPEIVFSDQELMARTHLNEPWYHHKKPT